MPNPVPIRLPRDGEAGVPFVDLLAARCGDKRGTDRMIAFIQEWDHIRDEIRDADPSKPDATVEDFAKRWNTALPTAFRMQAEFRRIFPTETTPGRVVDLLWDGMPKWPADKSLNWLLAVEVVERRNVDRG